MPSKSKRTISVGLVGALLIASALGYLHFRYARPVGQGPADRKYPENAFGHPWTTRHVLVVGLGDSVTAGFGARKGYSYFDKLIRNSPDESEQMDGICLEAVLPNLSFTNLAVSGSTSNRTR